MQVFLKIIIINQLSGCSSRIFVNPNIFMGLSSIPFTVLGSCLQNESMLWPMKHDHTPLLKANSRNRKEEKSQIHPLVHFVSQKITVKI